MWIGWLWQSDSGHAVEEKLQSHSGQRKYRVRPKTVIIGLHNFLQTNKCESLTLLIFQRGFRLYSRPCAVPLIQERALHAAYKKIRALHAAYKNAQGSLCSQSLDLGFFGLASIGRAKRTLDQSSRHMQFCLLSSFTMGCSQSKSHPAAVVAPEKRTGETSSFKPGDSSRAATVDEKPKPLVFAIMRNGHVSCRQEMGYAQES